LITKERQERRRKAGDKVICGSCDKEIKKASEAYVEILHVVEDPYFTQDLLEGSYLVHKPEHGPNQMSTSMSRVGERLKGARYLQTCLMGDRVEASIPSRGDITHIIFPLDTVTDYGDDFITWNPDKVWEVRYSLNQKGLPAWQTFLDEIELLLEIYHEDFWETEQDRSPLG